MKFLKICALYSSAEEGTLTRLRNHPFMGDGGGGGAGEVAARFICVKLIMVRLNSKVPPAVSLLVRAQDRQRPNGWALRCSRVNFQVKGPLRAHCTCKSSENELDVQRVPPS